MPNQNRISQLFRLDGKVALVTGASKGIGEALWCDEKILHRFLQHIPFGRAGEPDDVAGLGCSSLPQRWRIHGRWRLCGYLITAQTFRKGK